MNFNPYETPSASLGTSMPVKRSIWWKIYFFFMLVISSLSYYMILSSADSGLVEVFSSIFMLVSLIGMYGFSFSKTIFSFIIWRVFLPLLLIDGIAHYFITGMDLRAGLTDQEFLISHAVSWVISIPLYLGLFFYGYRSKELWKNSA